MGFWSRIFGKQREKASPTTATKDVASLVKIAKSDGSAEVRLAAIERISDTAALRDIFENDPNEGIRKAAWIRLIGCSGVWKAEELLQAVGDQTLIAEVAIRESLDKNITCTAIGLLTDPKMLGRVVLTCKDSYLIGLAVEKIDDQEYLMNLLAQVESYMGPYMIVTKGKFSDENLIKIAKTYPGLKRHAIERITNPEALSTLAMASDKPEDRLAAVERISDQAILTKVARDDSDLRVRAAATGKVADPQVRGEISGELAGAITLQLRDQAWPVAWQSLEHGPRLIAIISANQGTSGCPYFKSGVCMVRVMAQNNPSYGPEPCTWLGRPHRECSVWALSPR